MFKNPVVRYASFILVFMLGLFQNQFFVGYDVSAYDISAKDYAKLGNGVYTFFSALDDNKVVDIKGASPEDMARVQLHESNKSLAQMF